MKNNDDILYGRAGEALTGHKVLELTSSYAGDGTEEMAAFRELLDDGWDRADINNLPDAVGKYGAVLLPFQWSHVKREDQERLLKRLVASVGKNVVVVMFDNCYVDGESIVIARTDLEGNTHQFRPTADGGRVEVLKNFPTDSYLRKKLSTALREVRTDRSTHYWVATGRTK